MRTTQFALGLTLAALTVSAAAQSSVRKGYIIELADAPAAAYEGSVSGLAATRPAAGSKLDINASHVQAYLSYLDSKTSSVASVIPSAPVYYRYGVAFNGFAAQLTDAELQKLLSLSGVRAITADEARPLDTNYTPKFLGISQPGGIWSQLDASGRAIKGEDVIIAHVDGGVWPENPSFSDKVGANGKPIPSHLPGTVVYGPPPAKWTGICQSGLGFTASMCNNKLIGARYFNTGWKANRTPAQEWSFEYIDSPRDADGHGSHTLSTSGGNENVDVLVGGSTAISGISGIAPRARVAAYKTCYNGNLGPGVSPSGCFPSDSVAAINQAVADGADVINYSISGSQTSVRDAVETAFRNAAAAGVYVSASAGNANVNGAPTVAHNSPWVMTVGNSTHDRYTEAVVTLGNNGSVQGASFQTAGLSAAPLIWSRNAGFGAPAAQGSNQALCLGAADSVAPLLDPAKVAGKIVVCDRGGNVLVNKVANAKAAGAVGVIIQNTPVSANTTPLISAVLPTVHVPLSGFAAVTAEATANGTAAFGGGFQVPGVVAPVMSASSSRGPNQADLNVLKPDITGPGTDIIAAFANRGLTQAQRDAVAAGTLIPDPWSDMISGTSMSSPHSAGLGALLRQANPTWSPYAIKSAIMSSAVQTVKIASGAADNNRWGFGAGHLNPNAALATKVVFDQTNADHLAYYNGTLSGSALNLASMTAANVIGIQTFTRRLTNKGTQTRTYTASASVPGFTTVVTPASFSIAPGATQTFTVQVTRTAAAAIGAFVFGEVVLAGDDGVNLRSPVTVRPQNFVGVANVTDTRTVGTKVYTVATGYTGTFTTTAIGMVPADRLAGTVALNQRVCFPFSVPAGAKQLRAQMFNSETSGGATSDIDLVILRGTTTVGASGGATSDELVVLNNPLAATTYQACADGFAPSGGSATFTINLWVVPAAVSPSTLRAFGPSSVVTGGVASVGVSWSVPAGNRYLGIVEHRQSATDPLLSTTTVFIDASAAALASEVPLLRDKPLN